MNFKLPKPARQGTRPLAWLITVFLAAAAAVAQPALGPDDGLPVVSWDEAGLVVGQVSIVYGKIVRVGHTQRIHFLNFKKNDRNAFTAVIFSPNHEKFSDTLEALYLNKLVKIRGTVTRFQQVPQIVITKPDQITVIDKLPESMIPKKRLPVLGEELIVGSYNIKNLFDDYDDPYHNDETTPAKPRSEMERVAAVIREFNPDILALQEVESRGYLERFIGTMLPNMGYRHVVHFEGNDHRGIDVGLISRIPIGAVTSHRHLQFPSVDGGGQSFSRDLLQVEILPKNGDRFEVWIVHLKSNSGGREAAEPIRLGECRALHQMIANRFEHDPEAAFLICGDFNDVIESASLQTILGKPPLLRTIFNGTRQEKRITYNREPYRSMIDFMLCSPTMEKRFVPGSFDIRLGSDRDSGSDHNPIHARFRRFLSPTKPNGSTDDSVRELRPTENVNR